MSDVHSRVLAEWKRDLARTNYFESRESVLRQNDEPAPTRGPYDQSAHFRGRVMFRLNRRGWKLKQIAWIWQINPTAVFKSLHVDMIEVPSKAIRKFWAF